MLWTKYKGLQLVLDFYETLYRRYTLYRGGLPHHGWPASPCILECQAKDIWSDRFLTKQFANKNKPNITFFFSFMKLGSTSVYDLKIRGLVGETINVTGNILSFCDLPSNLYPPELEESCLFKEFQVFIKLVRCLSIFPLSL